MWYRHEILIYELKGCRYKTEQDIRSSYGFKFQPSSISWWLVVLAQSTNLFGELTDSTICQIFPSWVSQLRIQRFVNSSVSEETLTELLRGDFLEKKRIFAVWNKCISILLDVRHWFLFTTKEMRQHIFRWNKKVISDVQHQKTSKVLSVSLSFF